MNRGQALYINDHNRVAVREEVVTIGVFRLWIDREPVRARRAIALVRRSKPHHRNFIPEASKPGAEHAGLIERLLGSLRRAKKNGLKLSLSQLCEGLHVPCEGSQETHPDRPSYRTVRRILVWLCAHGSAQCAGNTKSRVYWAE